MNVSKNAYYNWKKAQGNKTPKASMVYLKTRITAILNQSKKVYGSLRIQKALEQEKLVCIRFYIALLMKQLGLKSAVGKQFKGCTTDSKHGLPIAENILSRDFSSDRIGEKWVSDISSIKVNNHWSYINTILDLANRKIVAYIK